MTKVYEAGVKVGDIVKITEYYGGEEKGELVEAEEVGDNERIFYKKDAPESPARGWTAHKGSYELVAEKEDRIDLR